VTPIVASHKRACRRTGLLRGTGVVVSTLAVAGFTAGVGYADPVGGSPNHDTAKGTNVASENPRLGGAVSTGTASSDAASSDTASAQTPAAVEQQVAGLYQQVDADTQTYDATEERIAQLQALVAGDGSRAAQLRGQLATASAGLGRIAAEQYRDAGLSPEMTLVFATHPDAYLERAGMNDRLADLARQRVLAALTDQQDLAALDREASANLNDLKAAQTQLAVSRADIEARLTDARGRLDALGGAERQQVTTVLAHGGTGAADGLGATVSVAAPSLSSLIASVAAPPPAGALPGVRQPLAPTPAASPSSTPAAGAGSSSTAPPASNPSAAASPSAATVGGANTQQAANQPMSPGDEVRTVKAISAAYSALGKPYVWGATGPNQFDCSGLTQHVWASAGVILPRTSQEQADTGQSVPLGDIRPGDLVIYYAGQTHVGIYVGQGLVIHAPRPGAVVQFAPVDSMPIDKVIRPMR
jgi:peptidoglycan DL-endopeptidase CwlO